MCRLQEVPSPCVGCWPSYGGRLCSGAAQQYRAKPDAPSAIVADHDGLGRAAASGVEGGTEESRIRLRDSDLTGNNLHREQGGESEGGNAPLLTTFGAVRADAKHTPGERGLK